MIAFDLGLLADHAQVDANGKLSVFGEFRYIFASTVPVQHAHMSVVGRWVADLPPEGQLTAALEIDVVDSDGVNIVPRSPKMAIRFAPVGPAGRGKGQCQVILNLNLLVIPKYGDFAVHFIINGEPLGRVPFHVAAQKPSLE